MIRPTLVILYAVFAVLAIICNLITQRLSIFCVPELGVPFAVLLGTFTGLLVKYVLDKYWIFHDNSLGLFENGRKFTLYSLMGVFTTTIFWSSEMLFWLLWQTHFMRELGAVLGLGVGYLLKYQLDRSFVFGVKSQ
ncbi:MAG: polysaccharide biosynthesis protein GtrA [Rhodospirillaceae bacterium]|nr:polysaccharide biosynthesis protein GtrA [Rhodospirillaceae bacterium]|tara:strand:+ start:62 stop:469 length:408 start_codon:yes stop_codon:yes gene_type:complete